MQTYVLKKQKKIKYFSHSFDKQLNKYEYVIRFF